MHGSKIIFVAGTDTQVGKSVVSGLLAGFLVGRGYKAITQKWVQSGGSKYADLGLHLKLAGIKKNQIKDDIDLVVPYHFKFPGSPHLSSKLENIRIKKGKIKDNLKELLKKYDFLIVEGTGGLMVPINKKDLIIDIIKEMSLPVLLVSANKLGTINHTLLSIEALKKRKIKILGIVFNNLSKPSDNLIFKDNPKIVGALSKEKVMGVLGYSKDIFKLKSQFHNIGKRIIEGIR